MTELLQRAAERVQDSMDEILTNFKLGAKITVLVRTPDKPTADFCMTSDDLDEVIAMVQRRKGDNLSPQTKPAPTNVYDGLYDCLKHLGYVGSLEVIESGRMTASWIGKPGEGRDVEIKVSISPLDMEGCR
jgi:hypothetical protein